MGGKKKREKKINTFFSNCPLFIFCRTPKTDRRLSFKSGLNAGTQGNASTHTHAHAS